MCDGEKFALEIVSLKGTVDGTINSSTGALLLKPPRIVTQFGSVTENADLKCSWNNQESWTGQPGYLRHRGENLLSKIAWLNVSFVTISFPRTSSVIISFDCFSEPSKNQSQLHHWLTFSTAAVHSSVSHQFESLQNLTAEKDFPVGNLLRHVGQVSCISPQFLSFSSRWQFQPSREGLSPTVLPAFLAGIDTSRISRLDPFMISPHFCLPVQHLHTHVWQVPGTPLSQSWTYLSS